jgi:hypothetical protein
MPSLPARSHPGGPSKTGAVLRVCAIPALLSAIAVLAASPVAAQAHGPVAPVAIDYVANVGQVPPGVQAKVVDGDQKLWLSVAPQVVVVVLDYNYAPYLRFSANGVQVNRNSEMYYLNATPLPQTPPANLTRATPPSWQAVSGAHNYSWHDARLSALAATALPAGTTYVGRWSLKLTVDGRLTSIAGGVWHAGAPSLAWLWFVLVLIACVLAAWRVQSAQLDARVAQVLGAGALIAFALGGAGQDLHGRPTVTVVQLVELAAILAFVAWALQRVLLARAGYFAYLVFALIALWEGLVLFPTLSHGFTLLALPAVVERTAAVLCLGCGIGILPLVFRLAGAQRVSARARPRAVRTAAAEPRRERSVPG